MDRRRVLVGLGAVPLTVAMARAGEGFAQQVAASMPHGMDLPPAFVTTLEWLDANGFVRGGGAAFLVPTDAPLNSDVSFRPVDTGHVAAWLGNDDPRYVNRLAPIIQTGGDGSFAALWLRDAGSMALVQMGSDTGSTPPCVLTIDPVDMLRLMAIGYAELCYPEILSAGPELEWAQILANIGVENGPAFRPPLRFRQFIRKTFDVTIPALAAGLVTPAALSSAPDESDPFWQWVEASQAG